MAVFTKNAVALITGGASGVGLAIAKLCLSHSMRVAIVDYDSNAAAKVREALSRGGDCDDNDDVATFKADVSRPEQWVGVKKDVLARFGGVDMLVLNAGVSARGGWDDAAYFDKVMGINLFGVIHGLNAFVPYFQTKSTPSSVVITGSKQGITNPPGNPAYNASKAAVKSLAEQLSYDMRGTSTSVHLLVPGWTHTGMTGASSGGEKPAGAWLPEQVAERLETGVKKNEFYIICPDNEVTEEMDKKRIAWGAGDMTEGRQPLSRWREEYKEEVKKHFG